MNGLETIDITKPLISQVKSSRSIIIGRIVNQSVIWNGQQYQIPTYSGFGISYLYSCIQKALSMQCDYHTHVLVDNSSKAISSAIRIPFNGFPYSLTLIPRNVYNLSVANSTLPAQSDARKEPVPAPSQHNISGVSSSIPKPPPGLPPRSSTSTTTPSPSPSPRNSTRLPKPPPGPSPRNSTSTTTPSPSPSARASTELPKSPSKSFPHPPVTVPKATNLSTQPTQPTQPTIQRKIPISINHGGKDYPLKIAPSDTVSQILHKHLQVFFEL